MDRIFFVYGLIDPRTNEIFYIGKGKGDRPEEHLKEAKRYEKTGKSTNVYKSRKILNILKAGFESYKIILLHKDLTEDEAFALESKEIESRENLTNIGEGGRGGDNISKNPNRDEIIEKIRKSVRENCLNADYIKFLSEANSGEKNGMYGKHHTQASRDKMSKTRKKKFKEIKNDPVKYAEYCKRCSECNKKKFANGYKQPFEKAITEEQLKMIKEMLPNHKYSWYIIKKKTGLTKKIIQRVCRQNNIKENPILWGECTADEFYGEDAQEKKNIRVTHHFRGKSSKETKDKISATGKSIKKNVPILCIELNKTFKNLSDACKFINRIHQTYILRKAIEDKTKLWGYTWEFIESENTDFKSPFKETKK